MTDVMEQGGSQDGDLLVFGQCSALPLEAAQEPSGQAHDTQGVGETTVIGSREHELAHPELLDATKPLKLGRLDQAQ
ncbi:MAG: hypothetical protein ABSH35_02465 [Isosphaeraceae bacterium]